MVSFIIISVLFLIVTLEQLICSNKYKKKALFVAVVFLATQICWFLKQM